MQRPRLTDSHTSSLAAVGPSADNGTGLELLQKACGRSIARSGRTAPPGRDIPRTRSEADRSRSLRTFGPSSSGGVLATMIAVTLLEPVVLASLAGFAGGLSMLARGLTGYRTSSRIADTAGSRISSVAAG